MNLQRIAIKGTQEKISQVGKMLSMKGGGEEVILENDYVKGK